MTSIARLIGRALAIALAFTVSSHLFSRLSKDSIDAKRKKTQRGDRETPKSSKRIGA